MEPFEVTEEAATMVAEARSSEDSSERLGLWIEVSGVDGSSYAYDVYFQEMSLLSPGDLRMDGESVPIVIPAPSIEALSGARLEVNVEGELAIVNPNSPPKSSIPDLGPDALSNDLALQVQAILQENINPSIAAHGGFAELAGVVDSTAYVVLGGGCQGCGLAAVTLSQGISVAITEAIPAIRDVVDVTDHMAGSNPYFQGAKK
ncbi:MAG: NifU family protein [Ferrimicrobium sp.]